MSRNLPVITTLAARLTVAGKLAASGSGDLEAIQLSTAILKSTCDVYEEIAGLSPRRQQHTLRCLSVVRQYQRGEVERSDVVAAFVTMQDEEEALPPRTFHVGEHVYFWYIHSVNGRGYADSRGVVAPPYNPGVTVQTGARSYCIVPEEHARKHLRREHADAAYITRTTDGVELDDRSYPTLASALRAADTAGYRRWHGNVERWPDRPRRIPPCYRSRDEVRC